MTSYLHTTNEIISLSVCLWTYFFLINLIAYIIRPLIKFFFWPFDPLTCNFQSRSLERKLVATLFWTTFSTGIYLDPFSRFFQNTPKNLLRLSIFQYSKQALVNHLQYVYIDREFKQANMFLYLDLTEFRSFLFEIAAKYICFPVKILMIVNILRLSWAWSNDMLTHYWMWSRVVARFTSVLTLDCRDPSLRLARDSIPLWQTNKLL